MSGVCVLSFTKYCQIAALRMDIQTYPPTRRTQESHLLTADIIHLPTLCHSVVCGEAYLFEACSSLMTNELTHLFISLAIVLPLLWHACSYIFAHYFFLLDFLSFSC